MRFDGQKLKDLREARRWDQHRLAEAARRFPSGITQAQVSRHENGQQPSGRNALAYAFALDVPVRELYEDDDELCERREAAGAHDAEDAMVELMHAIRRVVREEIRSRA